MAWFNPKFRWISNEHHADLARLKRVQNPDNAAFFSQDNEHKKHVDRTLVDRDSNRAMAPCAKSVREVPLHIHELDHVALQKSGGRLFVTRQ